MKKKKLKKIIKLYKGIVHGTSTKFGLMSCYDTYYKGCWDKDFSKIKNLTKKSK